MAKTTVMLLRIEPTDRDRLQAAAALAHLDFSSWARKTLLDEADRLEELIALRPTAQATPKKAAKRSPRTK